MKSKRTNWTIALFLSSALIASCSTHKVENSGPVDESDPTASGEPMVEAGTDAVPQESTELQQAAADGTASTSTAGAASESPAQPTDSLASTESMDSPAKVNSTGESSSAASGSGSLGAGESYTVQSGDTLMKIAFQTYGDLFRWKEIYEDNKDLIKDANQIPKGTQLKLRGSAKNISVTKNGERYEIQEGDTLGKISSKVYGTPSKWKDLWKNNPELIKNPHQIFAGLSLYYLPATDGTTQADPLAKKDAGTSPKAEMGEGRAPASVEVKKE